MRRLCRLIVAWLIVVNGAVGAEPGAQGDQAVRQRIAGLIRQLGDDDFARREAAERALIAIGQPAVQALERATLHEDAEVATRADRAWGRIVPFRVRLIPDRDDYVLGQKIVITFRLENRSDRPIKYSFGGDYRGTGRHQRFDIKVVDGQGREAPDPVLNPIEMGGLMSEPELQPGEAFTHDIELAKYRRVDQAGVYDVAISHDLGWDAAVTPPPVGRTRIKVRTPTPVEARAIVADPANLARLTQPFYLPYLVERVGQGHDDAIAGIAGIATVEATEALVKIIDDALAGEPDRLGVAISAYAAAADRVPDPRYYQYEKTHPGTHQWYAPNRAYVERTWRAAFAPAIRRLAARLARDPQMTGLDEISRIYERIGEPDDLTHLAAGFTKAIERTKTLPFETHQYFRPRGAAYHYRFSAAQLLKRGAKPPTAPKTTGEAAIFLIAMRNDETYRPDGWRQEVLRWLDHPTPYMREFVLDYLPEPAPDGVFDRLPALLADEYVDLQIAACKFAAEHPRPAFAGPIRGILRDGRERYLLNFAAEAAPANGIGRDEALEIWLKRSGGDDLGAKAFERLLLAVLKADQARTPNSVDEPARRAAADAWRRFIDQHRDELRRGKRFDITDAAITADLFPPGFQFYRDGQPWPAAPQP